MILAFPIRNSKFEILNKFGGEAGIRTLGGLTTTTVFETAPFNRSGTSPIFFCVFQRAEQAAPEALYGMKTMNALPASKNITS
jgi:hypothetical protein